MKKLLAILGLVTVCASAKAQQVYSPVTITNNAIIAASASFTNGFMNVTRQKTVGVQLTTGFTNALGGLPAGAMLWYFYRSVDGSTVDSLPTIVGSPAQTVGTNSFSTNIDTVGMGYIRVVQTNTIATTNLFNSVVYGAKGGTAQ